MSAAAILARLIGAATLAAGALVYGNSGSGMTALPIGSAGKVLTVVAGAPAWATNPGAALPASFVIGDLLYASSTSALSSLADVATGSALVSGGVGVAPAWSTSMTLLGTVGAKPTTTAGIRLDPNAATGNFTLSLSPANITAARRWSFPDRSDTVAGLGAQTFTGQQIISDSTASTSTTTGALKVAGGVGVVGSIFAGEKFHAVQNDANGINQFYFQNTQNGTYFTAISLGSTGYGLTDWPNSVLFEANPVATGNLILGTQTGSIVFQTNARTSVARITSAGYLLIGGSSANGKLSVQHGTITAALPTIDSSVTWNAAVTFTGWKLNVTSTSSNAGSLLMDLQLASVSQFSVRKDSLVTMAGLAYSGAANGELWYDTTQKCLQNFAGGIKRSLSGLIYSAHETSTGVGVPASGTTAEIGILPTSNSYGTLTLPANFFVQSKALRITVRGRISDPGSGPTLRLKCKLGTTLNFDTTAFVVNSGGDSYFTFVIDLFCSAAGASGAISGFGQFSWNTTNSNVKAHYWGQNLAVTTDTTTSQTLSVTAQLNQSGPIIYLLGFAVTVEALN